MNARVKDANRLNIGAILSEFLIIEEKGSKNVQMMDACDRYSHSWFGWNYMRD